jgi:hypothetical protein
VSQPGYTRDLAEHVDRFGNIGVDVEIGGGPGTAGQTRTTGASARPAMVARFLRELADDVERAGDPCRFPPPT